MNKYNTYLNPEQQKKLIDFDILKNIDLLKSGDSIKYIGKSNYKFKEGGIVLKIYSDSLLIMNFPFKYKYMINLSDNIIFYKKKKSKNIKFMEYILSGLENNTIKITKKR
uniref:Uncharacterized protein n=1 Tax=viral metagenome TaxID=1070528 RepID=A0A6C0IVX5_9ZZZZ